MTLRVDNVGSMLRPPELVDAVSRHEAGDLSDDGLRAVEDAAVRDLVAEQERHDLPIVVDGEFRRLNFMQSFTDVAGFDTWMDRHRAPRGGGGRRRHGAVGARAHAGDRAAAPAPQPAAGRVHVRPVAHPDAGQGVAHRPGPHLPGLRLRT